MTKALFRKQMMEVNTWLIQNRKTGQRRSTSGMVLFLLLYVLLFASLGAAFFITMGLGLCEPLHDAELDWLYFALSGMLSILLGIFGSVFNTYATLYKAKDNEMLLAMPIPPRNILLVRLFGVWFWSLVYEALIWIPTTLVYWLRVRFSSGLFLAGLALLFVISLLVLALACILGWVVARISGRLKNRSLVTVATSLLFIAAYYYVYFRINEFLQEIVANAASIGARIQGIAYPFYLMGRAGVGEAVPLLGFAGTVALLLLAVYLVLARSFLSMATVGGETAKRTSKKRIIRVRTAEGALFAKEKGRFLASATYMLNCGLGVLMLPLCGIVLLVKGGPLKALLPELFPDAGTVTLLATGVLCVMASMIDLTAPSVSLEGKTMWLSQSLPVDPGKALWAKMKLHLAAAWLPVTFTSVCLAVVLGLPTGDAVLMLAAALLFAFMMAALGLAINLKMPLLNWTNEAVPVKQSASVSLALFGGWGVVVLLGAGYFFLRKLIAPLAYLGLCMALFALTGILLARWIRGKGAEIFANL